VRLAYQSELGLVRQRNEDAYLVPHPDVEDAEPWVVAVADGMGGHPAGDVASTITVQTLADELGRSPHGEDLLAALQVAHEAVAAAAAADPTKAGMGTTAVVAVVDPSHVELAHVGDSRAYLVRNAQAIQLTHDHNRGGYLTQSVGHRAIEPELVTVDLAPGDRLLLCTDGLTGLVPDHVIGALVGANDPDTACTRLVEAALTAGGHDNITVILVEV
jgi:protein phosphatase